MKASEKQPATPTAVATPGEPDVTVLMPIAGVGQARGHRQSPPHLSSQAKAVLTGQVQARQAQARESQPPSKRPQEVQPQRAQPQKPLSPEQEERIKQLLAQSPLMRGRSVRDGEPSDESA